MKRTQIVLLVLSLLQAANVAAQDRMPMIPSGKQTKEQKQAVTDYKDIRKVDLDGPPWSVLLRVPDLVVPSLQLRLHNQFHSVLSRKLTEFAIIIAARNWTNHYEWDGHSQEALKAGLNAAILTAVADGRRPEQMTEDEAILYDFCTELLHNQSVSDHTYARGVAKFGEPGVIEAASLVGYYTYLAIVMNAAHTPMPFVEKLAAKSVPN
jgi:4-carboxymuconolactone decarboxylase